jgi:hypothetical protein
LKIPSAILAREGFTFTLPERSAAIWFYRKINKGVGVN